jgi:spermidine synthase
MEKRFFDPWTAHTHLTYTVTKFYESFETPFQRIDVFEAKDWGTVLALGGVTNVTDRDECGYHEMLAHPAMFAHAAPRRVLIVGGGDGGTLREVLRHPEVEEAVLVDIDGEVIRCARDYFPRLAEALDHPKATVIVGDGLAYVEEAAQRGEHFDVILIDSTDPVDAAVELFTDAFYRRCGDLLGQDGILVPQSDSPTFYMARSVQNFGRLQKLYRHATPYLGQTMAYPGGLWTFIAATNAPVAVRDRAVAEDRIRAMEPALRYFNVELARAMFALPTYVRRALAGEPGLADPAMCDDGETYGR